MGTKNDWPNLGRCWGRNWLQKNDPEYDGVVKQGVPAKYPGAKWEEAPIRECLPANGAGRIRAPPAITVRDGTARAGEKLDCILAGDMLTGLEANERGAERNCA